MLGIKEDRGKVVFRNGLVCFEFAERSKDF
jgi:hypothetical protein